MASALCAVSPTIETLIAARLVQGLTGGVGIVIAQAAGRMNDHGNVEKTGPLPGPLSLDGQPEGADPIPGDIGYYAPSNDLVLYYGDQDYFPGIVRLGTLHGNVDAIARYDDVTVRVERATN